MTSENMDEWVNKSINEVMIQSTNEGRKEASNQNIFSGHSVGGLYYWLPL